MKIQISQTDNYCTSIKVDGKELGNYASEFTLSQNAGEIPLLTLQIPVTDGMEIDLPEGAVVVEKENLRK